MSESTKGNSEESAAHWVRDAKAEAHGAAGLAKRARASRRTVRRQRRETTRNTEAIDDALKQAGKTQARVIRTTRTSLFGVRARFQGISLAAQLRLRALVVLTLFAGILWLCLRIALALAAVGAAIYVIIQMIGAALAMSVGTGG